MPEICPKDPIQEKHLKLYGKKLPCSMLFVSCDGETDVHTCAYCGERRVMRCTVETWKE